MSKRKLKVLFVTCLSLFVFSCENSNEELEESQINLKSNLESTLVTDGCDLDGPTCGFPNSQITMTYETDISDQNIF